MGYGGGGATWASLAVPPECWQTHTGGCCVGSEGGRYWADEEQLILSGGGGALNSSRMRVWRQILRVFFSEKSVLASGFSQI